MTVLSSSDLTYMRESLELLMPGTCYILSSTPTSDGAGGMTETWGTVGTAVCRLDGRVGGERTVGESIQPVFSYILTLPYNTTIVENYRVVVDSNTFAVTSIDTGKSWAITKRVTLERV